MAKSTKSQPNTSRNISEKSKKSIITKTVASKATARNSAAVGRISAVSITKVLAELIGTFILTMIVIAAVSGNFGLSQFFSPQQAELLAKNGQTAVVFAVVPFIAAFTLGALVLILGKAAWGHFNPAITTAFMTLRKVSPIEGLGAIVAQILGAMLALVVALRLFKTVDYDAMRQAIQTTGASDVVYKSLDPMHLVAHTTNWTLFSAELIGAVIFGFGVASLVAHGREALTRAVIVGSSLLLGLGVAAAAGAGVLNPAVAIGLGLVGFGANAGEVWSLIGIYIAGPLLGAIIGMALYKLIGQQAEDEVVKA